MKLKILVSLFIPVLLLAQQEGRQDSTFVSNYQPGDHELLLMPTAYTMEKGQSYFEDYELFFINFSTAVTNSTHLSLFSLFPITTDFLETLSLGVKQNFYHSEKFSAAAWASYWFKSGTLLAGGVVSLGKKSSSFHLSLGYGQGDSGGDGGTFFMLGYRGDMSRKFSFIAEYGNATEGFSYDFSGLLTIGIRFRSESMAWDLGGIRPLDVPADSDLLFLPLLKASVVF
jgi:hypothetical protein